MVRHQKRNKKGKCLGSGVYQCVLAQIFFFCAAVSVAHWEQEQCLSEINTTHSEREGKREGGGETNTKVIFLKGGSQKREESCGETKGRRGGEWVINRGDREQKGLGPRWMLL